MTMKEVDWKTLLILFALVVAVLVPAAVIDDRSDPPAEVCLEGTIPQVIGGVVHIKAVDGGWQGSGFVVESDVGVTARHVVDGGGKFVVTLNDGRKIESTRAISSKKYDVGFLRLDHPVDPNVPKLGVGSIFDCRLGQSVFVIGSPFGFVNMNSVTLGIVSRKDCDLSSEIPAKYGWPSVTFQTDTNGEPGNSGCPVFSLDGIVRGILVGGFSNGVVYCVPSDVFMQDLERVKLLYSLDSYQFEEMKPPQVEVLMTAHSFEPLGGF
jgi:S1-C subfamily serine protease